jgi:hypothetical protein
VLLHEEKKFNEWASRIEDCIAKKDKRWQLKESCRKLIVWSKRIKEKDSAYCDSTIKPKEFSLIARALPVICDDFNQTLIASKKHGKFTKAKQQKIMSFVYNFDTYLVPLAERISDKHFLKDTIKRFMKEFLPDVLFDLTNIDDYQIGSLLDLLNKAQELKISDTSTIRKTVETEIVSRKLEEIASKDLEGESDQVEFKENLPDNIQVLAKEIAAFASTKGGRIYLGVDDNGGVIGVDEKQLVSFDKFQQRIAGIATEAIKPALTVAVETYQVGSKTLIQIRVPKGSEPAYYVNNVPYIRVLTTSRPATPQDIKSLHLRYFISHLQNSVRPV